MKDRVIHLFEEMPRALQLPSGKFDCNDLILHLGMFAYAYNGLRLIGQLGLTSELAPVRHPVKRRQIKTCCCRTSV